MNVLWVAYLAQVQIVPGAKTMQFHLLAFIWKNGEKYSRKMQRILKRNEIMEMCIVLWDCGVYVIFNRFCNLSIAM